MPRAPRPLTGLLIGVLGVAVLGIAIVSGLWVHGTADLTADLAARQRTHLALTDLERLMRHMVDAETGQRGFVLTGDTTFLEPQREASRLIGDDTLALRDLADTDDILPVFLGRAAPLIGRQLAFLERGIAAVRSGRSDAARAAIAGGEGKRLLDSLRAAAAEAANRLRGARDARSARVTARVGAADTVVRWSSVLATALLSIVIVLAIRMVGALHRAERATAASERRLVTLLDALPIGVFVVDAGGRPAYDNHKSRELLGREELPDVPADQLPRAYEAYRAGTDELYPGAEQPIVRALGGAPAHCDDIELRGGERRRPIEVWAAPVRDERGVLTHAVAAFSDLTQRRRLEANLERRAADLQAAYHELEQFNYSISHDLRAPLRAIDGFSRILEEDYGPRLDDEGRRVVGVVRGAAQRMAQLIDDLLRLSRFARHEMEKRSVNMTSLARAAWEELTVVGDAPRLTLGPLPEAVGDPALLRQVWANYLGNAIKYSRARADAAVEVRGWREVDTVIYAVSDNGVGFDPAYAHRLFGVFQRLHKPSDFEGSGVGLAIVERVVTRHGGRVWAESKPDAGATFYFSLPSATA